jgi:CRP/FNR family transcriptional regulator, cyclic AMP receptor protein
MEIERDNPNESCVPSKLEEIICTVGRVEKYWKDTPLFSEGEEATAFYFIKSGILKLTRKKRDGSTMLVGLCQPKDLLGEFNFGGQKTTHTASATWMDNGEIYVVDVAQAEKMINQYPAIRTEFIKRIGIHCLRAQCEVCNLLIHNKEEAFYAVLIRLCHSAGEKSDNGIKINVPLRHHELGNFVGLTRESVTRILGHLKSEGVISILDGGYLLIQNLPYLKEKIRCKNCPLGFSTNFGK